MQAARVTGALVVQPGVRSLLGAATETLSLLLETRAPFLSSIERTAGEASPSGFSAIAGSFTARLAFASGSAKASRGSASKEGRGNWDGAKEEDPGLIRVVLRKDLRGLGRQGDVVSVKRGRMRHELYPNGDAAYATPENIAKYALTDAQKQSRDVEGGQEGMLEKLLRALAKKSVVLTRRPSNRDPERFVGPAVTPDGIRRAVVRQLGIQLDPSHLLAEAEIKTYGTFKVPLNLRLPQPDDQQQIDLTVHVDRRGKDAQAVPLAAAAGSAPAAAAAAAARPA